MVRDNADSVIVNDVSKEKNSITVGTIASGFEKEEVQELIPRNLSNELLRTLLKFLQEEENPILGAEYKLS